MKLGGAHRLGSALGGEPLGTPVDVIFARMVTELRELQGRVVRTVQIVQGNLRDADVIAQGIQAGSPGYLLGYLGAAYNEPWDTSASRYDRTMSIGVLCIADSFYGQDDRVVGMRAGRPSLANLMGWAAFYGGRALHRLTSLANAGPVAEDVLGSSAEHALGLVTFRAQVAMDLAEDYPQGIPLERAGIVHGPREIEPLYLRSFAAKRSTRVGG